MGRITRPPTGYTWTGLSTDGRRSWSSCGAYHGERLATAAAPSPVGGRGSGTPGRLRGTRTRSASGRIAQRTGVGIRTDSPSIPTGIVRCVGVDDDLVRA